MAGAEAELLAAHAGFLADWNRALRTGDVQPAVRWLGRKLFSWFGKAGAEPSSGDRESYAESIRATVGRLGTDPRWVSDPPLLALRGPDFGVLAARVWLERADEPPHPKLVLAAWRREEEQWRLLRLYEEVGLPERLPVDPVVAADDTAVATWDACLRSGDPEPSLALQSPGLQAVFGHRQMEQPQLMDAAAYREGCREVVVTRHARGWRTAGRIAEMRGPDEGIIAAECRALTGGGEHPVFNLSVWRRSGPAWQLVRTYEEG